MPTLAIDVWSDIACPWCYIGKRRLEAALAGFEHAADVRVTWRAFELDPTAPQVSPGGAENVARLARKLGTSPAQAKAMMDWVTATAAEDGLDMRMDTMQPANTFDAHRLVHLGTEHGKGDVVKEHLFRAYFTEGKRVSDPEVLVALAVEAGLDPTEARTVVTTDRFSAEVRQDETRARDAGIRGVPCFVLDRRLAVSGAQPRAVLLGAIQKAWGEVAASPPARRGPDGEVGGGDGC